MTQETIIELDNHLVKCRCCLREFHDEDIQIKITRIVEERFQSLTQMELRSTETYSHVICESCNSDLRNFSSIKKDLVFKQMSLIQFVEGIEEVQTEQLDTSYSDNNIKDETLNDSAQIKTEHYEEAETEDFANFVSPEYLENIQEIENDQTREYDQFCSLDLDNSFSSKDVSKTKKFYKRALCGLCGNSYYKDQLQRHIDKVHYKVKRFFCDICGFGSFLKCNLNTHMAKHVAKEFREQIRCDFCDATFTRHESLKNHIKTEHETPVMLKCFCGKEFNLRHKLTTHIKRTHNNVRDHACKFCEKKFFTPKELKVHILKVHTPGYIDKTEHFCEICGKKYSSTKSLRTHMKHHQEPEFKCEIDGCNKGFITKLLLANHQKIHTGQRDFMCHLCEKSFYSANHLRRHIAVSHDKVRINCFVEGCRFAVGRKDYLRNHILTHRELPEDTKKALLLKVRDMKL
ncbi:hypothetical protein ACKWTF_012523 [Chironomus riparius]